MESLPGLVPLYTAQEMRTIDRLAVDEVGIPGVVLMERAGLGAAAEILAHWPDCLRVAVICGAGNNGGDGFVVARHIAATGRLVQVLMVEPESKVRRESRTNLGILHKLGVPVRRVNATGWRTALENIDLVVDAMLGTGVTGPPRPNVEIAVDAVHRAGVPVVALDVPSGIDASTGEVAGRAVAADLTITFHGLKAGLAISPGRMHAGRVRVVDIGIPASLEAPGSQALATVAVRAAIPPRERWHTKYTAGRVLCVGGSTGMTGAIALTARAASRAGAGIVFAATPKPIAEALDVAIPEVQFRGVIADPDGRITVAAAEEVAELVDRVDAVVIGPGLGSSDQTTAFVRWALRHTGPLVLDASALTTLAGSLDQLAGREAIPTLLTPHEAELAALLGIEREHVAAHRLASVRAAAEISRCTVLLKGEDTIISRPDGNYVVARSHKSQASAGTGDVLAGVAATLMARGMAPCAAATCAATACGLAAEWAASDLADAGVIASDLIERLPAVLACKWPDASHEEEPPAGARLPSAGARR